MNVARILLLVRIRGLTNFRGRVLISNEDFGVVAGSDLLLVFDKGWILGCGEGREKAELEEEDREHPIEEHVSKLGGYWRQLEAEAVEVVVTSTPSMILLKISIQCGGNVGLWYSDFSTSVIEMIEKNNGEKRCRK